MPPGVVLLLLAGEIAAEHRVRVAERLVLRAAEAEHDVERHARRARIAEVEPAHLRDVAVGRGREGPVHRLVGGAAEQVGPAVALPDEAVRRHAHAVDHLPRAARDERRIAAVVIRDERGAAAAGHRLRGIVGAGVVEVRLGQHVEIEVAHLAAVERGERDALHDRVVVRISEDDLANLPVVRTVAGRHLPAHRARVRLRGRVGLLLFFVDEGLAGVADEELQVDGLGRIEDRVVDLGQDAAITGEVHPRCAVDRRAEERLGRRAPHGRGAGRAECFGGGRSIRR